MIRTLSFFMGVKRNFSLSCFSKDYTYTFLCAIPRRSTNPESIAHILSILHLINLTNERPCRKMKMVVCMSMKLVMGLLDKIRILSLTFLG